MLSLKGILLLALNRVAAIRLALKLMPEDWFPLSRGRKMPQKVSEKLLRIFIFCLIGLPGMGLLSSWRFAVLFWYFLSYVTVLQCTGKAPNLFLFSVDPQLLVPGIPWVLLGLVFGFWGFLLLLFWGLFGFLVFFSFLGGRGFSIEDFTLSSLNHS